MDTQASINYHRIEEAIIYIHQNFKAQPTLEEIAANCNLSPAHFQRLFTEWAGTSPKKFLQYISLSHARKILKENQATLAETAYETGLSGTSRLHDLFVSIEGMTPAEYKNGGRNLSINYSFSGSLFGKLIVASTVKGVCYMAFAEDEENELHALIGQFPQAKFQQNRDIWQSKVLGIFGNNGHDLTDMKLHLKATDFQLKVWESLLTIPAGRLTTYGSIATQIGNSKASRAVGTAIGSNPVAYLIPCHRVIQSSGLLGGYMWGVERKTAMIGWEAAQENRRDGE